MGETTIRQPQVKLCTRCHGILQFRWQFESVGIQCALCHSTVDNSLTQGIGHRLDGWANRDLNVGDIVSLANLQPFADLLGVDQATVHKVLQSWGTGHFDAELALLHFYQLGISAPRRRKGASTKGQPSAVRPFSTEQQSAPVAMSLPSTRSLVGTCTLRAKSAWTASRLTVPRTNATALHL